MKKLIAVIIAALMLMSASAMAELVVDQVEYLPVLNYSTTYCYFFAKVTNNGDASVTVDGSFDMLDANGTAVATQDIYGSYPYTIAPGQTAYINNYKTHSDTTPDQFPDVRYTIVAGSNYSADPVYLTVTEATATVGDDGWGNNQCTINVTLANNNSEPAVEPTMGFAMFDQNGDLMYCSGSSVYSVTVPAGSSMQYTFYAPEALLTAWTEAGRTPTTVEAVAYTQD